MEFESTSFWSDIKKYENTLAEDPHSLCFAQLAELYLKIGLVDDALAVSRRGVELHSEYAPGILALGKSAFEMGLFDESRVALEKVVEETPDNLLALKLLAKIYQERNQNGAAERALKMVLALNPTDIESRLSLESLATTRGEQGHFPLDSDDFSLDDDDILELEEVIEEAEIVEDDFDEEDFSVTADPMHKGMAGKDPLTTATLADIYVSQGFFDRALNIYLNLLNDNPDNAELKRKLSDLRLKMGPDVAASGEAVPETEENPLEDAFPGQEAFGASFPFAVEPGCGLEPVAELGEAPLQLSEDDFPPPAAAEKQRAVLEEWLGNIKRMRECR